MVKNSAEAKFAIYFAEYSTVVTTLTMLKRKYVGISIKILTKDLGRLQREIQKGASPLKLSDLPSKNIYKMQKILKIQCSFMIPFNLEKDNVNKILE